MNETSVSLLERLRRPNAQPDWTRLVALYTPLLRAWARKAGRSRSRVRPASTARTTAAVSRMAGSRGRTQPCSTVS